MVKMDKQEGTGSNLVSTQCPDDFNVSNAVCTPTGKTTYRQRSVVVCRASGPRVLELESPLKRDPRHHVIRYPEGQCLPTETGYLESPSLTVYLKEACQSKAICSLFLVLSAFILGPYTQGLSTERPICSFFFDSPIAFISSHGGSGAGNFGTE